MEHIFESLAQFWEYTGFANCTWQNLVMIAIGLVFITLAIVKEWEPMLLVPLSQKASRGDQILNARSFEKQGFARVLEEEEINKLNGEKKNEA